MPFNKEETTEETKEKAKHETKGQDKEKKASTIISGFPLLLSAPSLRESGGSSEYRNCIRTG